MAIEQLVRIVAPDHPHLENNTADTASQDSTGVTWCDVTDTDLTYQLASNRYGHYCIPDALADTDEAQALTEARVTEPDTLSLICRKLGSGDIVTGCTGVGSFLPALHEALSPNAFIHAFEPNHTALAASSITAQLNGLENLHLHQIVPGKRNREVLSDKYEVFDPKNDGDLEMKKLDTIVPEGRYVSVIHITAQGREMPAILGAKRIVQDSAPLIILRAAEAKKHRFFLSCLQARFPDLEYQFAGVMEGNSLFLPLVRD